MSLESVDFKKKPKGKENDPDDESISSLFQEHVNHSLEDQLFSAGNVFSKKISEAIKTAVLYQPALAYKKLSESFNEKFILTENIYKNKNYIPLLNELKNLAVTPQYFDYAANQLLHCAVCETELKVPKYKALFIFISLFHNTDTRTKVSLEDQMQYLSSSIQNADPSQDYDFYRLEVLLETIGTAANVFKPGGYEHIEDPYFDKYINSVIEILMLYAGVKENDGLYLTAEEKLHELLEATIKESDISRAGNIPYINSTTLSSSIFYNHLFYFFQ